MDIFDPHKSVPDESATLVEAGMRCREWATRLAGTRGRADRWERLRLAVHQNTTIDEARTSGALNDFVVGHDEGAQSWSG